MKKGLFIQFFVVFFLFNVSVLMSIEEEQYPLQVGCFQLQSTRDYQEDYADYGFFEHQGKEAVIAAVFDGHGLSKPGDSVSKYLKQNFISQFMGYMGKAEDISTALSQTFADCHAHFQEEKNRKEYSMNGSTAVVTVWAGDQCRFANLGDSRGYVKTSGGFFATEDHNLKNEEERKYLAQQGALFANSRLNGCLATARGFGDCFCKFFKEIMTYSTYNQAYINNHMDKNSPTESSIMNNEPDISMHKIEGDSYILLASGGFFDVVRNKDVDSVVQDAKNLTWNGFTNKYKNYRLDDDPRYKVFFSYMDTTETRVAKLLTYYAVCHKGSEDNTTVVFMQRGKPYSYFQLLKSPYVTVALGILTFVLLYWHKCVK